MKASIQKAEGKPEMLYEHALRRHDRRSTVIRSVADLMTALEIPGMLDLQIDGALDRVPTLHLRPGQSLRAAAEGAELRFLPGHDGVRLACDNTLLSLSLQADPAQRAVFNDEQLHSMGRLCLAGLRVCGQVQILARGALRAGQVDVDGLDIEAADTRARTERLRGFGVEVLQGAFTLWNQQADSTSVISTRLKGLSTGRPGAPVLGGGILVAGGGFEGGRVVATVLETGAVHSDGRIDPDAAGRISGGVFIAHGAFVGVLRNQGTVATHGAHDMVLYNSGTVNDWIAEAPLSSHGAHAIGVVNFGTLHALDVRGPVETFGPGAPGFHLHEGKLGRAVFDRITIHGEGAAGEPSDQRVDGVVVRHGIQRMSGSRGAVVQGVKTALSAVGLSKGCGSVGHRGPVGMP